jgi:hypothetical protein
MELARRFDGKKFMWDGKVYPDEKQAQEAAQKYQADGFHAALFSQDNQFYVFTRREVKESVGEGKSS